MTPFVLLRSIGATAIYHITPDGLKSPNHVSCFRGRLMIAASARRMRGLGVRMGACGVVLSGGCDGCLWVSALGWGLRVGACGRLKPSVWYGINGNRLGWSLYLEAVVRNQWQTIGVGFVPCGCGTEA